MKNIDQMINQDEINQKLSKLIEAFSKILYEDDAIFMENMKSNNLAGDDISKYQYWEWPQGVGLFGIWKMYERTKDERYLTTLKNYYDRQLDIGFPSLNVNTMAPFLAMSFLGEHTGELRYIEPCREAARWIMETFPRTDEGGFQHITSDTLNEQELWDDTLFMTVLFLANMGRIENRHDYRQEASYQFLLHVKYLQDRKSGLFYHGWTFKGNHNFAEVFWGRGNCWITIVIPEFFEMMDVDDVIKRYLSNAYIAQISALSKFQAKTGMWRTIIDDETSYEEASATCGFAYGIIRGIQQGIIPKDYMKMVERALTPILNYIDEDGVMNQVSYGTAMGRDSREFYKEIPIIPMPYGQALAILFLHEWSN